MLPTNYQRFHAEYPNQLSRITKRLVQILCSLIYMIVLPILSFGQQAALPYDSQISANASNQSSDSRVSVQVIVKDWLDNMLPNNDLAHVAGAGGTSFFTPSTRRNLPVGAGKTGNIGTSLNAASSLLVTETKLIANDGGPGNNFGSAVAVSGNTVVVGDDNSVYAFTRSNGIWAQQQKLSASGSKIIAIDGDIIAAAGGNQVAVFVRNGATWALQQLITININTPVSSVDISGDTIVIGTAADREGCPATAVAGRGAALVFVRSGALWAQQQKLTPSDGECGSQFLPGFTLSVVAPYIHYGDQFGYSVSISGDTILVGAYTANTGNNVEAGAAYVFGRSNGSWIEKQKLLANDVSSNDYFGFSVAVDGDTAVIGAIGSAGALTNPDQPGSAYVFGRSIGTWTQQQQFAAGIAPNCFYNFGSSVAVSGDAIVVSCNCDLPPASPISPPNPLGSAYLYMRNGSVWGSQSKLMAGDGVQGDNFGNAVAISGPTIVVGSYRDDTPSGTDAGSAYVFESDVDTTPPVLTVPSTINLEAASSAGAVVNYSVSVSDNRDPNPTVHCAPASGSLFPIGTTLVNCTATDASNNSARDSFAVNVADVMPPPTPTPTPNPCLTLPGPQSANFRKSVALGAAPAVSIDAIGGTQDLLYHYASTNSPCPTNTEELDPTSNIRLLKESGTTWVRLWIDWAELQPYSSAKLADFQLLSPDELAALAADTNNPVQARTARWLINLDGQIRTAHKENLQVILTLHHRYPLWANNSRVGVQPLPGKSDAYGNILGCDDNCQRANDPVTARENVRRQRRGMRLLQLRNAFGRVPTNLYEGSPWAQWVHFLVVRYGLTKDKVATDRAICSHNFNGQGCGDYLRYVDFLEIVNEPNITHWPQRDPDTTRGTGRLVMPAYIALMFRTAKAIVDRQNTELQLDQNETTIKLLGPATADSSEASYKRTSYYEFNRELFKWLKAMRFRPGPHVAWSHHNYGDVEYARYGVSRPGLDPDECRTNSAAWTRKLLKDGAGGYKWEGWPRGDNNPELLTTEGGARLERMPSLWGVNGANIAAVKEKQAALVVENFNKMNAGSLSNGIAMINNYLTYSDPSYDTGLLNSLGSSCTEWHDRAGCAVLRSQRIPCRGLVALLPCACTGVDGARRPLYDRWKMLQPSR